MAQTDERLGQTSASQSDFSNTNRFLCDSSGNEAVVSIIGEVDIANISDFDSALQTALASNKPVIIDLTQCRYLDSTFVSSLLKTVKTCPKLRLTAKAGSSTEKVFKITGLEKVVAIDYTF